jgi:hypothetical protein
MNSMVDHVFRTLLENRELARILLREAVGIDADFDRKLHDFYARIGALIAAALETGMQIHLVRPLDPQAVARCILGAAKETVHYAFVEKDPTQLDVQQLGRELIGFTLKGLFT